MNQIVFSEVILKPPKRGMWCGDTWSCHRQLINIRQEEVNRMLMGHDSFVFHRVQSGSVCVCVWETSAPSVKCLCNVVKNASTKAPDKKKKAEGIKTSLVSFMEEWFKQTHSNLQQFANSPDAVLRFSNQKLVRVIIELWGLIGAGAPQLLCPAASRPYACWAKGVQTGYQEQTNVDAEPVNWHAEECVKLTLQCACCVC